MDVRYEAMSSARLAAMQSMSASSRAGGEVTQPAPTRADLSATHTRDHKGRGPIQNRNDMSNIEQLQAMAELAIADLITELDAQTTRANDPAMQQTRDMAEVISGAVDAYALRLELEPSDRASKAVHKKLTDDLASLKALGGDRSEGDSISARLQGATLLTQSGLSQETKDRVSAAQSAWSQSAPKAKGTRGGARAEKADGTPIVFTCSCGWSNTDRTDPNSARWSYFGHLINKKEGHGFTNRPKQGDSVHTAVTDAIYATAKDFGEHVSKAFDAPNGQSYTVTSKVEDGWVKPAESAPEPASTEAPAAA